MSEPAASKPKQITCDECRELLSGYIDRELTDGERAAVEHHVATCIKCASESTQISGLKKVVQHWDGVQGSGEFRKQVVQQMIRESQVMSSAAFTQAADAAAAESARLAAEQGEETKSIPPIWIILAAGALAAAAYYLILWLRS